jgi:membrane-associated phospholipid phosphatase
LTPDAPIALHAFVYAFGASIGMGRIMADRHFFTDVVAGSAIGVGITRWVFANSDDNHAIFFRGNSIALQIRF